MNKDELAVLRKALGMKPQADPSATHPMNESNHQMALFRWAGYAQGGVPELRWLHSIPNGGFRTKASAGKMKGEGQKPGVPDIFLDVPRAGFHGLRIELKVPRMQGIKGITKTIPAGALSCEQEEWMSHYQRSGYAAHVAYGWEHAKQIIQEYLK